MRSKVDLHVVGNPVAAGISAPAGVMPTGGMHDGKLYLFTDNISVSRRIAKTFGRIKGVQHFKFEAVDGALYKAPL
jgi:hypothetical protein